MAAPQAFNRGWLDTRANVLNTFKEDQLVKSLKTRNSTIPMRHADFTVTTASKWAYLLTYGAYKIAGGKTPDQYHIQAVSVGELIAPVLPNTYFLPQQEANLAVLNILKYFADNETIVNRGRTKATYVAAHNNAVEEELADVDGEEREDRQNDRIDPNITTENFLRAYAEGFVDFLLMASAQEMCLPPIEIFCTLYIAVAKRGNVTEDFLMKIITGLTDDLQYDAKLTGEAIGMVYKFYGGYITADNAKVIMDTWLTDIPETALRVRLTLMQATNSGLTALVTAGRAMRKYADFPWARLNNLTGGELTNFRNAVNLVGGNQYYGFNKSLGAVRSTMYSSTAYVAKELLITLNGETSLRRYAGWVKAPKNAAVVKTLIDNYKQDYVNRMENGEVSVDDQAIQTALDDLLLDAGNANLFA